MEDSLVSSHPDYRSQRVRLATFGQETRVPLPSLSLAAAGFIRSSSEQVKCVFCNLELKGFDSSHSPLAWHRTYSRNCPFLRDNDQLNVKDLAIQFPEVVTSTVVLDQVLPRETIADDAQPGTTGGELVRTAADAGNLTIQNTTGDTIDDSGELPTNPDELNRIYRYNSQLRYILHKTQIDTIKSGRPREAEELSTASLNFEHQRRLTFANWPIKEVVSPKSLAASGFTFTGNRDVVECVYCKVRIQGWTSDMVPDAVHQQKSPGCQFIQGSQTVLNIPDILGDLLDEEKSIHRPGTDRQISLDLGIITDSTKHPQLAVESRREATFLTWPRANKKLASELIEHKLFYTGQGDTVCCFSCGVEMSKWSAVEDIWLRHARQSPNCQLLIREKGQDFVTSTIEEHGRYVEPAKEPTINVVTTRMLRPRFDSPVAQAVLDMVDPGYRREDIRAALILNIKYGGNDFMYTSDLIKAILDKKSEEEDLNRVRRAIESEPPPPTIVTHPTPHATRAEQREVGGSDDAPSARLSSETQDIRMAATGGDDPMVGSSYASEPSTSGLRRSRVTTPPLPEDPLELARTMKAQLMCKICMDAVVGIAFLPCGHMVCCPSCAPAMVQCPLCRQDVRGTVRAYLDKL